MSDKFSIVNRFAGYIERDDITNIPPNHLVIGSQNVISTDGRRVGNRKGYTLFGQEDSTLAGISASYDWIIRKGGAQYLRAFDDTNSGGSPTLQFLFNDEWYDLIDGLNSSNLDFAEFWNTSEELDLLLFVDGSKSIYSWSGGVTTFASATSTTLTKEGTKTWAEEGFLLTGDRRIIIDGTEYQYTGGEDTLTLTGVTPDPTLAGHSVGDVIYQKVTNTQSTPFGDDAYVNNTIAFVDSNPDTITDSSNQFLTEGFQAGDIISITGSASNDGTYTIATVVAGTITLVAGDSLTVEAAGANVLIKTIRSWSNDIIETLRNQVYVGSFVNREVYLSAVGDYTDFSAPSVPRVVGEPAILNLDAFPVGFIVQEEAMYISAGKSQWYQTQFQLSSDLESETIIIKRLKTAPQQGAISNEGMWKIKNDVVFISNETKFDTLGRVELIATPQSIPMSDPVEQLFNRYDFTNASGIYFNDNIYIAAPAEGTILIYNMIEGYWEAPQTMDLSRFSIIDGELYGHSSVVPETYKLFEGFNDIGNPINAIAAFSYQNFGTRTDKKVFQEWYTEGYITESTTLNLRLNYDYTGFTGIKEFAISGDTDSNTIFKLTNDASLGKLSLGKASLGGKLGKEDESLPNKFRTIETTTAKYDFYEIQPIYFSNEVDYQWELLAFGGQTYVSKANQFEIKK